MSGRVLILRPQPGADRTARRALGLGLVPTVAPLFTIRRLSWQIPDPADHDSLILTSANAAREAGGGLTSLAGLPCYAVGSATAAAAAEAGLRVVAIGDSDGGGLLDLVAADGRRSPLHLCGREHFLPERPALRVTSIPVYAADAVDALAPAALVALAAGAVVLLHSPRAARLFRDLIGAQTGGTALVAISAAVAEAAGPGWAWVEVAAEPSDHALLEAAAKLCHRGW